MDGTPVDLAFPVDLGQANAEEEHLEDRVVVGKWPSTSQKLPELRVERLDRVGRVEHAPNLRRVGQERHEVFPAVSEGPSDLRILAPVAGFDGVQGDGRAEYCVLKDEDSPVIVVDQVRMYR